MLPSLALGLTALLGLIALYISAVQTPKVISPQGCRMSYMSPHYVLQTEFNSSWTPLARRYSLWLYREAGWESEPNGLPVLFIPGNAGSSRQVRSIASSAARQYYSSPWIVSPQFSSRGVKPLDFYAAEFNEDLSAFHGPTLESQINYVSQAIAYISSLYLPNTSIILIGHSMGGIVATAVPPSPHISAIITMSSPHNVPPARFDSRIDDIYRQAKKNVLEDPTPILSICGGITDTMIPSEFCAISEREAGPPRMTVFTSALEGCWTGVGHIEMVWCHQVRWRVARLALEMGAVVSPGERVVLMQRWFRDGIDSPRLLEPSPSLEEDKISRESVYFAPQQPHLLFGPPERPYYVIPLPSTRVGQMQQFNLFFSAAGFGGVAPSNVGTTKASVFSCTRFSSEEKTVSHCSPLAPSSLKLIPHPPTDQPFPLPGEGVDESEGVVAFSAQMTTNPTGEDPKAVVVKWDDIEKNGRGWAVAVFLDSTPIVSEAGMLNVLLGAVHVHLPPASLQTSIQFPYLPSNVLFVYRLMPKLAEGCSGRTLDPLLLHTSSKAEAHYFPLKSDHSIFLHSHSIAPFLPAGKDAPTPERGLSLTVFSSGECSAGELIISVDSWKSIGRWGPRYWNAVLSWSSGVIGVILFNAWSQWDAGGGMPSVAQSINHYCGRTLPWLLLGSWLVSFFPLSQDLWLGNSGNPIFAAIAPIILVLSSGLVVLIWWIVYTCMAVYGKIMGVFSKRQEESHRLRRRDVLSILLICVLVFLLIPWQVAFMGCYLLDFHHCATASRKDPSTYNHKMHIILTMTICLPVVGPVLAVWARTLATAGLTTPFEGDHFVVNVIGFMFLTYYTGHFDGPSTSASGPTSLFTRQHRYEPIPVRYCYAIGAVVSFLFGPRSTYRMYESLNVPTLILLVFRVLPRLFGWNKEKEALAVVDGGEKL